MINFPQDNLTHISEISFCEKNSGCLLIKNRKDGENAQEKIIKISVLTNKSSFIKKIAYFFKRNIDEFTHNNHKYKIDILKVAKALNISKNEATKLVKSHRRIDKIQEISFSRNLYENGIIKYWEFIKLVHLITHKDDFEINNYCINENTTIKLIQSDIKGIKKYTTDNKEQKSLNKVQSDINQEESRFNKLKIIEAAFEHLIKKEGFQFDSRSKEQYLRRFDIANGLKEDSYKITLKGKEYRIFEVLKKNNKEIYIGTKIGSGDLGKVYEAHKITSTEPSIAIKKARKKLGGKRENFAERDLRNEAIILSDLNPEGKIPGIQKPPTTQNDSKFLATDLYNGSADKILKKLKDEEVEKKVDLCRNLVKGIHYAHTQKYVHGDIKPQNILYKSDKQGKIESLDIADWGGSKKEKNAAKVTTTPNYVPNKILSKNIELNFENVKKMDVYALSISIVQIYLGITLEEFNIRFHSKNTDSRLLNGLTSKGMPAAAAEKLVKAISSGRDGKLDDIPSSEELRIAFNPQKIPS